MKQLKTGFFELGLKRVGQQITTKGIPASCKSSTPQSKYRKEGNEPVLCFSPIGGPGILARYPHGFSCALRNGLVHAPCSIHVYKIHLGIHPSLV